MKLCMRWFLFVLCFCTLFSAKAQWTITENTSIQSFELTQTSGLYKGIISDLWGYVWIASDNALYRYDGNTVTTFKRRTASRFLKDFYRRDNGDLLVLHDAGLDKITTTVDTAYFESVIAGNMVKREDQLYYPKEIFEDSRSRLWISESQSIVLVNEEGLTRFEFEDRDISANLLRSISVVEDGYGNIWAMTFVGNLYYYDVKAGSFEEVDLGRKMSKVSALLCVDNDQLIFGGAEGVFEVKTNAEGIVKSSLQKIADIRDVSKILSLDDQLLIGSWQNGLYLYSRTNKRQVTIRLAELSFNDIIDLHKTPYGIWVMGNDKLSLLTAPVFNVFKGFGEDEHIEALVPGTGNELIVSSGNAVAFIATSFKGLEVTEQIDLPNGIYVSRLALDGDKLWLGKGDGTIHYFDLKTKEVVAVATQAGSHILSMILASDGNLWACGNHMAGVFRVAPDGTLHTYAAPDIFNALTVKEYNSTVFLGGKGKEFLFKWDPLSEQIINLPFRLNSGPMPIDIEVNDLAFDEKGIYLATSHGLYYARDRNNPDSGLEEIALGRYQNTSLVAVQLAQDGSLWIAGNNGNGIIKVNDEQQILFNKDNGLPSRIIFPGGILLDDRENVWVSTLKGVGFIQNPNRLNIATPKPFVVSVRLNGQKQSLSEQPYDFPFNSLVQINYHVPSFPARGTAYRYRINEISEQWSELFPLGRISLFDLDPGSYTLELQAQRESGYAWSDSTFMNFSILTPWHQLVWVRILFFILGSVLIYLNIKLFNRRLINRNKRLEAMIAQKAEEIDSHKQEIIAQQEELLGQKEELIAKNQRLFETSSALDKAEIKYREVTQTQLEAELDFKNKQLTTHALHLLQKNKSLEDLSARISELLKEDTKQLPKGLRSLRNQIDTSIKSDRVWDEFKLYFEQIYSGFYSKLKLSFPELSSNDLKHCALMKLNLNNEEASSLFGVSPETVRVSRFRIQKKLGLNSQQALIEFLMKI